MKQELQEILMGKYPDIFRDRNRPMTETLICFGLEVGDGWYTVIDNLCHELTTIQNECNLIAKASQVKEKFATLHFYIDIVPTKDCDIITNTRVWLTNFRLLVCKMHAYWLLPLIDRFTHVSYQGPHYGPYKRFNMYKWTRRIHDAINKAEAVSAVTCELCGEPGNCDTSHAWIATVCDKCKDKRYEEPKKEEDIE